MIDAGADRRDGRRVRLGGGERAAASGRSAADGAGRGVVSAAKATVPHPRETVVALRPRRGRAGVSRRLSRRAHAACLADRRPARHRQGDARLSHGALRVRASGPGAPRGAAARPRWRCRPTIRRRAASPRRRIPISWRSSGVGTRRARCRTMISVDWCAARSASSARPRARGAGASASSTAADELNAAGANALLKILEEPPAKSLLLVVSHAPGRLLPTIRSRCRRLMLRPLAAEDVARAAADALRTRRRRSRDQDRRARRRRQRRARARPARRHRAGRCASASTTMLAALPDGRSARRCMRSATRSGATTRARSRPSSMRCATGSAPASPFAGAEPARLVRIAGRVGQAQRRGATTPRSSISSASRSCSTCSAGLPQPRAVDPDALPGVAAV